MQDTVVFGMNTWFAVRQFLPELLITVRDRGLRVVVLAPPPGGSEDPFLPGVTDVEIRFIDLRREIAPFADLVSLWHLWRILREVRPAISNISTPKMALIGGLAAWAARVPRRIYTLRGFRYETTTSWKRKLLTFCEWIACACADQIICVSRSVREGAIRDGLAPASKLVLLGDTCSEGVDFERLTVEQAPASRIELGIPEGTKVLGFVGRLTRDKGIAELVQSFRKLRAEGREVHLLLLGDFEEGDPVDAETVERIRKQPEIHWLGYVPEAQPYYRLMDIFVFPTYREGLGRVLMEAAAAGVPAVSTRVTGVVDVVVDGGTGILVPPRDPQALAVAIGRLLDEPEAAARMGRAAARIVHERFDNSYYLSKLADVLQGMAGSDTVHTVSANSGS